MLYDEDTVRQMAKYYNDNETRLSIAARFNCNEVNVSTALSKCKQYGITVISHSKARHQYTIPIMERVVEFTRSGMTVLAISLKWKRSAKWVRKAFRLALESDVLGCRTQGLQLNQNSDPAKMDEEDEDYRMIQLDETVNGVRVSWTKVQDKYIALPYLRCLDTGISAVDTGM